MKMNILIFSLSILLVIFADQTLGDIPIVHWEWRDLVCKTGDKGIGFYIFVDFFSCSVLKVPYEYVIS